ncbi:hypothetical protein Q7689_01080 [Nocardiopsis tropica]|nr:hypothetical protein [Nocardiopsis tropica]
MTRFHPDSPRALVMWALLSLTVTLLVTEGCAPADLPTVTLQFGRP